MRASIFASLALVLALACGDDDPGDDRTTADAATPGDIDPSRTIGSLTLEEARAICADFIEEQGGAGTTVMCDGFEYTVQPLEECAAGVEAATCTNTVGELETCIASLDGDACGTFTNPDCAVIADCAM